MRVCVQSMQLKLLLFPPYDLLLLLLTSFFFLSLPRSLEPSLSRDMER